MCERLPLVPLIVSVYVPVGALRFAVTVSVEVPVPPDVSVTGFGLNLLLVRLGRPVTLRVTAPLKPLADARFTV